MIVNVPTANVCGRDRSLATEANDYLLQEVGRRRLDWDFLETGKLMAIFTFNDENKALMFKLKFG